MYLQEVFDQLAGSEFSQLSIGGADMGVIDPSNYGRVLGHVNLGLTSLYTRFNLKEGSVVVPLVEGQDTYPLVVADLLKVEKVLTDGDFEVPLNQHADIYSCHTPSMSTLKVPLSILEQEIDLPDVLFTDNLKVVYRANHPKLVMTMGAINPATTLLELPTTHLLPLLYFVASRAHNPAGMNNEFHAGNSYYKKYEMACQELEGKGVQVDQDNSNTRLARGGWV